MRKGADCLSKWVGEAERQLRLLFEQARRHQVMTCVLKTVVAVVSELTRQRILGLTLLHNWHVFFSAPPSP